MPPLPHSWRAELMVGESSMASKPFARGVQVLSGFARGTADACVASRARVALRREIVTILLRSSTPSANGGLYRSVQNGEQLGESILIVRPSVNYLANWPATTSSLYVTSSHRRRSYNEQLPYIVACMHATHVVSYNPCNALHCSRYMPVYHLYRRRSIRASVTLPPY